MALTQILRQECPECHKIAVEQSRLKIGKTTIIRLACGHSTRIQSLESDDSVYESIVFSDGCKPRSYQIEAIKFAEKSNIRCIIADEQGLGKTIEALSLLRLHPSKLLPAAIVCPATVKLQWMYEIHRIAAKEGAYDKAFLTQVINNGKDLALPGFQIYIITYDMLKKDDLFRMLPEGHIKTLILDECQRIKNHQSDRAKAVQRMAKNVEHIVPMSGTPIKNNAGEYFTVLNLVAPTRFPHYRTYLDRYCDYYNNGWGDKVGGLRDPERFHADTSDIIIRRTKAEVLKDLPPKDRKFHHVELNRNMHKEYDAMLKKLEAKIYGDEDGDETGFAKTTAIIAIMSELRHITGKSKVVECVDYVTEYLMSTDRKLVVFVHHKDVMDMLEFKINEWYADGGFEKVLTLHSGLDGLQRTQLIEKFKTDSSRRVMLASTLAAGEGINLQFCSDSVMLERQWNPANEEQAEDRFHRFGQENSVTITYMIATGTIDEYFTELVEAKRAIVASTLDNKEIQWDQQSLMKELAETLVTRGMKAWKL